MKTYSVTLPEVTVDHVNRYLEQLYRDCCANPQEIHIAEADYEPMIKQAIPDFVPDDLHYELMGQAWVEDQIASIHYCREHVAAIVNLTTGMSMKLVKEATQQPGIIYLYEQEGVVEEPDMRQIDWYPLSSKGSIVEPADIG